MADSEASAFLFVGGCLSDQSAPPGKRYGVRRDLSLKISIRQPAYLDRSDVTPIGAILLRVNLLFALQCPNRLDPSCPPGGNNGGYRGGSRQYQAGTTDRVPIVRTNSKEHRSERAPSRDS